MGFAAAAHGKREEGVDGDRKSDPSKGSTQGEGDRGEGLKIPISILLQFYNQIEKTCLMMSG